MYVIGVDEAGRGALAGPVSVGAVLLKKKMDWRHVRGLADSKELTAHEREYWFQWIEAHPDVEWAVEFSDATIIDNQGIVFACNSAASRAAAQLAAPGSVRAILDAGLKMFDVTWDQTAYVKGDENHVAIALASVVAKVSRDRLMVAMASLYPQFGFDEHKGYGTLSHRSALRTFGMIPSVHRKTFVHI